MSLDTPDYTPWFRERPVDTKEYNRYGDIDTGVTDVICDLPGHDVTIQRLVLSTGYRMLELRIYIYLADLTLQDELKIVGRDGAAKWNITPGRLDEHSSDIFDLLVHDPDAEHFKLCLNRPIRCAHGVKIELYNSSVSPETHALELSILDRGIIP